MMSQNGRLAAALLLAFGLARGDGFPAEDTVKNGRDHPLLSRFAGSKMVAYRMKEFEEIALPAGKFRGRGEFEKSEQIEGKLTRIAYNYARDRSSLEVMRNYQGALLRAGFKTLFACAKAVACGADFGDWMLSEKINKDFPFEGDSEYWSPFNNGRIEPRYTLARGESADGSVVVAAIYVVPPVDGKNGGVYLEIVEPKPMETGKVTANLDAGEMAKSIAVAGRVAVYGVFFDTDKAEVKPESKPALVEMAKFLELAPALKVYIVGHTDNTGTPGRNLELSEQRAHAVVRALVEEHRVDAKRLAAKGVASFSPVASNDDEAGRSRNRRVELVKQ